MKLTKFTHACVRLERDGRTLVLDPGVFSELDEALAGADAVLITHEHFDHIDVAKVTAAGEANRELQVWGPAALAEPLKALGDRFTATTPGQAFSAAGFQIETFGGQHALIHPSVPVVANVGYLIDATVYHPGDSFTVPTAPVPVLLVPIHAPWSKVSEVLDFMIAVRAQQAFQVHDGLLNQIGVGGVEAHVTRIGGEYGTAYRHLDPAESLTL